MQSIPQEQVIKRFQALPDALKDAIFSQKTGDTILRYAALRDIPDDKTYLIGALTSDVLLGYVRPESFAFEIQKETGIDALKATQVAHDIDTEIFSEVRLELKKLYPPTIQTPTVQQPGFSGHESRIRNQELGMEQKPRPYVVQIPERFRKITDNSKLITRNEGAAQPAPTATLIPEQQIPSPAPSPATPPRNIPPHEAIEAKKVVVAAPALKTNEAGVTMDPVVPLPTFIQSKFKANELGIAGQESGIKSAAPQTQAEIQEKAPSAQDALKNAFGKFTVSSTAPETTKEPMSPYRETIEEPKKPAAKTQGKVIDLSQF